MKVTFTARLQKSPNKADGLMWSGLSPSNSLELAGWLRSRAVSTAVRSEVCSRRWVMENICCRWRRKSGELSVRKWARPLRFGWMSDSS